MTQLSKLHPSGVTMDRWEFPFKTPEERKLIQDWLFPKSHPYDLDPSIPF